MYHYMAKMNNWDNSKEEMESKAVFVELQTCGYVEL